MNESIHGERTASEPQDRVTELIEQQTAISELLHAIANSPHDLQPIFDAILDSATRLCRADICSLRLSEERGLRRVAMRGDPHLVSQALSFPALAEKGSHLGRIATSRSPTHIPDFAAVEGDLRDDFWKAVVNAGFRTSLFVPLLKDNEIVGIITLGRKQVQPFTDRQISLFRDSAAQATIALESTRRERQFREMQSELAHANRVATMGQLTASLAHEIAQPIATARNNARAAMHFLDRSPLDLGQVREALTCVVDDADRAGDILDRIRDHIKKAPPRKESVDLNHAITDVVALAQGAIVKNGVSIQTHFTEGLSDIQVDRVQLQQVVLNLILNAVEAMGSVEAKPRDLLISTEQHEVGDVVVAVRDSGPGIDPGRLDRVFDAFYTTKSSGVGMGLSICRAIIDAHGGRLWADVNPPRGAVFRFTLPNADKDLTNSFRPPRLTRGQPEDTVSNAAHQRAYEDNK
jgi:signal transduction histidine kinase